LKRAEEDSNDFLQLSGAHHYLIRWINYHLRNTGKQIQIENFRDHLKDGVVYTLLLNQLDENLCDRSGLEDPDDVRISKSIDNAAKLGVPRFIRPVDVLQENEKLNLLFCAEIYYRVSGLRPFEKLNDADKIGLAILLSERHKEDEDLKAVLPINPESNELIVTTANSILLAKMVEKADPNVIDLSLIKNGENLEKEVQLENLRISLEAAKKLNCDLKHIGVSAIEDQVSDLVLKTLYEILKVHNYSFLF
jgi:plastin-1